MRCHRAPKLHVVHLLTSDMKKILHILTALVIGGFLLMFIAHTWRGITYLRTHGREGTIVIGQQYSGDRWAAPLPLKKIRTYTATLAGKHQVVVESDQELEAGREYTIRFLTRDKVQSAPSIRLRPIPGALRLRAAGDAPPVQPNDIELMDRFVSTIMGALGPKKEASASNTDAELPRAPSVHSGAVPFLLGTTGTPLFKDLWSNSRSTEWAALFFGLLFLKSLVFHAWMLPWRVNRPRAERTDFVPTALRPIDPTPVVKTPLAFNPTLSTASPSPLPPDLPVDSEPVLKLPRKEDRPG